MNAAAPPHLPGGMTGLHPPMAYRMPQPQGRPRLATHGGMMPHPNLIPPEYLGYASPQLVQPAVAGRPDITAGIPQPHNHHPGSLTGARGLQTPSVPIQDPKQVRGHEHSSEMYARHPSTVHPSHPPRMSALSAVNRPLQSGTERTLPSLHHRHLSPHRQAINRSHSLERARPSRENVPSSLPTTDYRAYPQSNYRGESTPTAVPQQPSPQTQGRATTANNRTGDIYNLGSRRPSNAAPSPVSLPAKRPIESESELPLDLSVKKSRVIEAAPVDYDSDDDVILVDVQGPQNGRGYGASSRVQPGGGHLDPRRPQSDWNFPQLQAAHQRTERHPPGESGRTVKQAALGSPPADKQHSMTGAGSKPGSNVSITPAQYRQSPDNYRRHSAPNFTSDQHRLPHPPQPSSGRFYPYAGSREPNKYDSYSPSQTARERSPYTYPSYPHHSPREQESRPDRSPVSGRTASVDRPHHPYPPEKARKSEVPLPVLPLDAGLPAAQGGEGTLLMYMLNAEKAKNRPNPEAFRNELLRHRSVTSVTGYAKQPVEPQYVRNEEKTKSAQGQLTHFLDYHRPKEIPSDGSHGKAAFSQPPPAVNKLAQSAAATPAQCKKEVPSTKTPGYGDGLTRRDLVGRESRTDPRHVVQTPAASPKVTEQSTAARRGRDEITSASWGSWKTSTLSIAESPVRLSTLMEPVCVSRRRNDGYLGDPSSPPPQESTSGKPVMEETSPNENNTRQSAAQRKLDPPIRSKKEYIFAHLQRDQTDQVETTENTSSKTATLSSAQGSNKTTKDESNECNGSNNNSNQLDKVGLKPSSDKIGPRAPLNYTPATVAYLHTRVIAEVMEQTQNETKLTKDETWAKPTNPEYFPRGAPLELNSIKRIPVANVQPIVKDKKSDIEGASQNWMNGGKGSDKSSGKIPESAKLTPDPGSSDSYATLREGRGPDRAGVKHQSEFLKYLCGTDVKPDVGLQKLKTGPRRSGQPEFNFNPYRTPTSAIKSENENTVHKAVDNSISSARKNLSLHFSTPKGRHKLYFQGAEESVKSPRARQAGGKTGSDLRARLLGETDDTKSSAAGSPSSNTNSVTDCPISPNKTVPNEAEGTKKTYEDRLGKTQTRFGPNKAKKKADKDGGLKKKSLSPRAERESIKERLGRGRKIKSNDVSTQGRKNKAESSRARKYPRRRQEKRQTRSSRLRRALRSARKCYSYNKNSAYEEELRKEEERKLLRKVQKHAQIRKALRHLDDGLCDEGQNDPDNTPASCSADESLADEGTREAPPPSKQSKPAFRKFRRRRKDYFDTERRAKKKRLQKLKEKRQDGESQDGLGERGGQSSPLPCKQPGLEDAGESTAELGLDTRTGSVHDGGSSTDQTAIVAGTSAAPDAKKLVVCKETGETILHKAARLGYNEIALSFMSCENVNVNVRDNAGYTPLHESCASGNVQIASWLIHRGADVNAKAFDGTRPLHDAVGNDYVEIARLLLAHGGDPTIANYSGKTPIKLSRSSRMTTFLEGYFADLNGGTGLEASWEFCKSNDCSEERCLEIDVLDGAPGDGDDHPSDTIEFEFSCDPFLPVHRLLLEKNKGPRNYHLLSDVARNLRMTMEDFVILNNDLAIVDVPAKTLQMGADTTLSSAESCDGEERRRVLLVQLDHALRQMLDISVEMADCCEPVSSDCNEIRGNADARATDKATKTAEILESSKAPANHIEATETGDSTNEPANRIRSSEKPLLQDTVLKSIKRNKSRNKEDCSDPKSASTCKSEGNADNTTHTSSTNKIEKFPAKHEILTGKRCHNSLPNSAKAKTNETRVAGHVSQSGTSPLALLSELSYSPYNSTMREVTHKLKAIKLQEMSSDPAGKCRSDKTSGVGPVRILSFGTLAGRNATVSTFHSGKAARRAPDAARLIVEPARFQYSTPAAAIDTTRAVPVRQVSEACDVDKQKGGGLAGEPGGESALTGEGSSGYCPNPEEQNPTPGPERKDGLNAGGRLEERGERRGKISAVREYTSLPEGQTPEAGDPALPILEKLDIDETSSETTEQGGASEDREMPQLTLYA